MSKQGNVKALALISGGLDSTLAAQLILDQDIEVEAVNCISVLTRTSKGGEPRAFPPGRAAEQLGVPLRVVNVTGEFLDMVRRPRHGYGSSMNPCIDCRILALRTAGQLMEETGARFVVTGEVLGQRPMSQYRRALDIVDRESGLAGLVLRPLSALILEPTVPENKGWVDRSRLMGIEGRSRKIQMAMAAERGITDYPTPAGGCLLTEQSFGNRLRDLWEHHPDADTNQVRLLKYGRHFRISPTLKLIVGRDEHENHVLEQFGTGMHQLLAVDYAGPLTLLIGEPTEDEILLAASIAARYGQGRNETRVRVEHTGGRGKRIVDVIPVDLEQVERYRIP